MEQGKEMSSEPGVYTPINTSVEEKWGSAFCCISARDTIYLCAVYKGTSGLSSLKFL